MSANPAYNFDASVTPVRVGAWFGAAGCVWGGVAGVLGSTRTPFITTISHGIQWFTGGTAFWVLRSNLLRSYYKGEATPRERIYASTICGGVAGGGVTRLMGGRLVPALVASTILGGVGQTTFNLIDRWQLQQANAPSKPFLDRLASSKWIPLRSLSDDEYRGMLGEKLLSIEAEIALVDDKIEELEKAKQETQWI